MVMTATALFAALLPFLTAGVATATSPQTPYNLSQTLLNPTPTAGDDFGYAIAAANGRILVGAPLDDAGAIDAGAAYLFDAKTGALLLTLANPAPAPSDGFGYAVAIVGGHLVVAAPFESTTAPSSGKVYVFDGASGALLLTIDNPTPAAADYFGSAVVAFGSDILVGAPNDTNETGVAHAGAAYRFDGATGDLLQTFKNPSLPVDAKFGVSLAAVGGRVLVGAYDGGAGGSSSTPAGSAHLFDGATGVLLASYQRPPPQNGDAFGSAVATLGGDLVVGAFGDDTGGTDSGTVYVIRPDGTAPTVALHNPAPGASDAFGVSVAAVGAHLLVGAYLNDIVNTNAGAAYVMDTRTGDVVWTFTPPPAFSFAEFLGWRVAADGFRTILAAPGHPNGAGSGAVFVYEPVCSTTAIADAVAALDALIGDLAPGPGAGAMTGNTTEANAGRIGALRNRVSAVSSVLGKNPVAALAVLAALRSKGDGAAEDWLEGRAAFRFASQIDYIRELILCSDFDGDGFSTGEELAAGTNPLNPNSHP